jgi:RHS repeat-associated protein
MFAYIRGEADAASTLTLNGAPITARNGKDFAAQSSGGGGTNARWVTMTVTETKQGQPPTVTTGHIFIPPSTPTNVYDDDGNLTQDDRWNYTWDAENRLIRQETRWQGANAIAGMPILRIDYKYDAYWRRVEKKVSTWNSTTFQQTKLTRFAYDGWNLIAEWEAEPFDLQLVRTHHWGLDLSGTLRGDGGVGGLVLTRHHANPSGIVSSYVPAYDGTGNIVALFDTGTGKKVAEYEYGPFGEPLRVTGAIGEKNPIRWSTKYCDKETSLVYYGFRYYDPNNGRWIRRDPYGEQGGIGLTRAFDNNPVGSIDVLGLWVDLGNITAPDSILLSAANIDDAMGTLERVPSLWKKPHKYMHTLYALQALFVRFNPGGQSNGMDKFVFTCKLGWIDMGHFFGSAALAFGSSSDFAFGTGVWVEERQYKSQQKSKKKGEPVSGWGNSAWTPEDLPSDEAGSDFGASLKGGDDIAQKLREFFRAAGAVLDNDKTRPYLEKDVKEYDRTLTSNPADSQEYKRKHTAWKCLCDGDRPKQGMAW